MSDIMTVEQMQKGSQNLDTLEAWVEGAPNTTITTPNGRVVPTMSTAVANLTTDGIVQDNKTQRQINAELVTTVNSVSGGYFKAFDTRANLNAATGMATGQVAKVMSDTAANNGDYRYDGSTWVKGYDTLTDAINLTNARLSRRIHLNTFKGFAHNAFANGFVTGIIANQTNSGFTVSGGSIALRIPTDKKVTDSYNIWINVANAALNSGVIRVLVQLKRADNSNATSAYYTIQNGTTGWFNLANIALGTSIVYTDIVAVNLQIEASGGAVLSLNDIYVGDYTPSTPFTRYDAALDSVTRMQAKENLLPISKRLPIIEGITYETEKITIGAGKTFSIILPLSLTDKSILYYSMIPTQTTFEDMRIRFVATPTDNSATVQRDVYTTATSGVEFSTSVDFGKPVKSVRLDITAVKSNMVIVERLMVSYDPLLQSKRIGGLERSTINLSDVVDDTAINIATNPVLNTAKINNGSWTKSGAYLTNGNSINTIEYTDDIGAMAGETLYVGLPDAVVNSNTGAVTIAISQVKKDGTSVPGTTVTLITGSKNVTVPIVITDNCEYISIVLKATADATLTAKTLYVGRLPLFYGRTIRDVYHTDETGVQVSQFPYPKLNSHTVIGDTISYDRSIDANGDYVLAVPPTTTTVAGGQGVQWTITYPTAFIGVGGFLSLQVASSSRTVTAKARYLNGTTVLQEFSETLVLKTDGSFTDKIFRLSATSLKNSVAQQVTSVVITLQQANNATGALLIKRPILSLKLPNQSIKYIRYAVDDVSSTGMVARDRLYDALLNPVSGYGAFSVGNQLFKKQVDNPATLADFALINGKASLPTQLIGIKYIDPQGFEIVTIDSDDMVYLKKANTSNLYKITVDELYNRLSAVTLDSTSSEMRGTFDGLGISPIATNFGATLWGKVAGDGSLICVDRNQAFYLPVNSTALQPATGFVDVMGGLLTGWLFDVRDNIVLVGGYSATPNYGHGKINYSNDYGRTYKTILDLDNATSLFGANALSKAHIHGVAWDKWWKRVWVVMGDYTFDGIASGKILWCDNPDATTPTWHIEPRDLIHPSKANEQHIAVYPMEDCILFGSDCNPSYIARRARVSKSKDTLTDLALYLHDGLAYYPGQFWRHSHSLPVTIFLGSDQLSTYGNNPDGVLITYDGVNFSRIWSDTNANSNTSGRTSSYAYALHKERFVLQKRVDPRFSNGICWVIGRLQNKAY